MNDTEHTIEDLGKELEIDVKAELRSIVEIAMARPGSEKSLLIRIPDGSELDNNPDELASLVSRTANNYQKAARLAGIAAAAYKGALARYTRKRKIALDNDGKNPQSRESYSMRSAVEEHKELEVVESIMELAEYQEQACRVASESARKLYDKVNSIRVGSNREEVGSYSSSDFKEMKYDSEY